MHFPPHVPVTLSSTSLHSSIILLSLQTKQTPPLSFNFPSYTALLWFTTTTITMFTASKLAFMLTLPRPCTAPLTPISSLSSSSPSGIHLIHFNGRHLCLRRRLFLLSPKATADQQGLHNTSSLKTHHSFLIF